MKKISKDMVKKAKRMLNMMCLIGGIINTIRGLASNNFYLTLLGLMIILGTIEIAENKEKSEKIERYEKLCKEQQSTIRKQNEIIKRIISS
jgi:hypothetical protein